MTPSPDTPRGEVPDGRATVIAVGEFGGRVAGFLADMAASAAPSQGRAEASAAMVVRFGAAADPGAIRNGLKAAFAGASGPVVTGLWRPSPALCGRSDELAFEYRRPWLPIIMDHPHLRVGPLVVPGHRACLSRLAARPAQDRGPR